ncbi:flagellar hook-basal body complex protein FliE [bacterium]|nr:flagellar hook-basal body complex protein FliE [bacterium]
MSIQGVIPPIEGGIKPIESIVPQAAQVELQSGSPAFLDILRGQLDQMVDLQNEAERLQQALAAGQVGDINEVILAVQKADLALTFAIQLRNKVVEAYQEITRMQV